MADNSLIPHPFNYTERSELRVLFKKYLEESEKGEQLSWESITTRDGLPHNWVYDLFQDSQGRIWVGTWGGGLAKFESGKWQTYTTRDGLFSNEVTCIRESTDGRLWFATDKGLNVLEQNSIKSAGLAGKSLLNITFDQTGNLWAGCWRASQSGGGLFRYDGHQWQAYTDRQEVPGVEILKVFTDSQGRLWIGTYEFGSGAGVGCFDGKNWQTFTTRHGLANDCVYSMFEDPQGNMWFGTLGGVSIFDGQSWHTLTRSDGLVDDRIYCMLIDSNKKMWFGTEQGISRFDGTNWLTYTKKDGLVESLVRAIIEADDGSLWFGTYPYAAGAGGISVARYENRKTLSDGILDLLPGGEKYPDLLNDGNPNSEP